MKKIEELEEEVKTLKEKLQKYESDVSARFYGTLVGAIEHIETAVKEKTLNLDTDNFARSILTLADKSAKIFEGLKQGKESFTESIDKPSGKAAKSKTVPI